MSAYALLLAERPFNWTDWTVADLLTVVCDVAHWTRSADAPPRHPNISIEKGVEVTFLKLVDKMEFPSNLLEGKTVLNSTSSFDHLLVLGFLSSNGFNKRSSNLTLLGRRPED